MARLERELSNLIGRKVDLRTAGELSRYFRNDVVSTALAQYQRSLRRAPKLTQVCLVELTHEFVHKTGGGLAVWLPGLKQWSVVRRTKGESGSLQRRKCKILPVDNTKHVFGVDENVLPSGKSCSWCGSVLENTNGSILEHAEDEADRIRLGTCWRLRKKPS